VEGDTGPAVEGQLADALEADTAGDMAGSGTPLVKMMGL